FLTASVFILYIALCYGELAIEYPVAGAELTYAHEIFGLKAGFFMGWVMVLAYVGIIIFEFVSVGWIIEALFPVLKGPVLYSVAGTEVSLGGVVAGLLCTAILAFLNIRGASGSGAFQQFVTFGLIGITIIFVVLALLNGSSAHLEPYFGDPTQNALMGFFAVFVTVPFWFGGFNIIPQGMSEKKAEAPAKAIRTVLIVAIISAAIFYAILIFATGMAMPRSELLGSDLPVQAAVVAATGSEWVGRLVLVAGLLGLISTWNAFVYGGSRMLFALGRSEIVFPTFGHLGEKSHTPVRAILLLSLLGIVGGLFGKSAILPLVDTGAIVFSLAYLGVCLALLKFRLAKKKISGEPVSLVLPLVGVSSSFFILGAALYFAVLNRAWLLPLEFIVLGSWIIIGVIGFIIGRSKKDRLSDADRRAHLLADM
ncbi:MAG: APC family permease, partial [Pseudomonadota bacterium]